MKPYQIALEEYGIKQILGAGTSARVLEYFKKVGHSWVHDDEVAWCAAFTGYCIEMAGIKSTRALNARSYLKWGTSTKTPKLGDVVVLWRIKKDSVYGHVGFFISKRNGLIYILAGNQNDEVNIMAYPEIRLLDYRTI